jgi:1,6-anhydro-N-acetylmuramate kinase
MRDRFSKMTIVIAAAAVSGVLSVSVTRTSAQAPAGSGTAPMPSSALKTPWGEPDLQGIWTDETDTPLQRPARYANQEFFTEAQRAEIDRARSELLSRERRAERGTERDVSGSYNMCSCPSSAPARARR